MFGRQGAPGGTIEAVRCGVSVPNVGDLEMLLELGTATESAGWDGFFLWDQIRLFTDMTVAVHDPWVVLAALAERTERIRIGTLITPIARRRPWKLARETVTLDHLSGGRLVLGVGLGFPPDAEFELLGEDPDPRVRAAKLDEGLEILTRLWSGERVDHAGEHFRVRDTTFAPAPVQRPRIPIWVGGVWPNRGPFRRAARWDGVYPLAFDPSGEMVPLPAETYPELLAAIAADRTSGGPFDVLAGGIANGDAAVVAPFEDVGATWWIESDEGVQGWERRMLDRIRGGPPA